MADNTPHTNAPSGIYAVRADIVERIKILPDNNAHLDATLEDTTRIINDSAELIARHKRDAAQRLHAAIFLRTDADGKPFDPLSREAVLHFMATSAGYQPENEISSSNTRAAQDMETRKDLLLTATEEIFKHFPPVDQSHIDEIEREVQEHNAVLKDIYDGTLDPQHNLDLAVYMNTIMDGGGRLLEPDHVAWMEQDVRFARLVLSVVEASHTLDYFECKTVLAELYERLESVPDLTPMGTSIYELVTATLAKAQQHIPRREPLGYDHEGFRALSTGNVSAPQLSIDLVAQLAELRDTIKGEPTQEQLDSFRSIMERSRGLLGQLQERVTKALLDASIDNGLNRAENSLLMTEEVLHYVVSLAHNRPDPAQALRDVLNKVTEYFPPALPSMQAEYKEYGFPDEQWFLEDMRFTRLTLAIAAKAHDLDDWQCAEVLRNLNVQVRDLDNLSPLGESVQSVVKSTSVRAYDHTLGLEHSQDHLYATRSKRRGDITRELFEPLNPPGGRSPSSGW